MNEAEIFFTVLHSVVALVILVLFARDGIKWLKRRRTKDAPDLGESSASDNESKPAPKRVI